FGHVKGAFTGATVSRKGLIEEADGGTFFLDEVGTTPPPIQAKLLRVLEDKMIRRIGENKSVRIDIRILAATNQDLPDLIKKKEFREDLYYRLNVVSIHLPPLRARRSDIPLLAEHFLKTFCEREGKPITGFSPDAMTLLLQYDFPGNVRELSHVVEQAVALANDALIISDLLPVQIREAAELSGTGIAGQAAEGNQEGAVTRALDEREREIIIESMDKYSGNLERVAQELGMSRVTLWRRMKKYGIKSASGR
ncbi:MAG: sigma-54-dependent Fis family transcriptional regulator, partial [Acidobacteria bacterium]|nr:sigma-54-dependent Fis family transcriptional regulator [Acidobacteriota bacterium]